MGSAQGMLTRFAVDLIKPGTPNLPWQFDYQNETLVVDESFKDANGLRGELGHHISRVRGANRRIGGPVNFQPNQLELEYLLPWICGGVVDNGNYPLYDVRVARQVFVDRITRVFSYSDCVVDKATFRGSEGEPLSLQLDLVGVDENANDAFPADLAIDTNTGPFMFTDCVLTVDANPYNAKEIEIVIDYKIDKARFLNSRTVTATPTTDREVSVRFRLPQDDAIAVYNSGPGGIGVNAAFTNGAALTFNFTKVAFPRKSPHVEGRSEIWLPMEGIAYRDDADKEVVISLA